MNEETVKFDIKFKAIIPKTKDRVDMIINVETQNDFYPGYPIVKRGIYYASRMISSQYGPVFTDSHYEKIKKVYSIWICPNPPEYRKNTIVGYHMTEEAIVGKTEEKEVYYDLITVIMVCLGGKDKEGYNGILKMLDVLFSEDIKSVEKKNTLQEEFGIDMTKKLEGDVEAMCNLSKGVYERAVDKAVIGDIKNLMENTKWDIDKCMDMLGVSEQRREIYRSIILGEEITA